MENDTCRIVLFDLGDDVAASGLDLLPTVCLFVCSQVPGAYVLRNLVTQCLAIGGTWFASYGKHASRIEDEVDAILEESRTGEGVPTTSHESESVSDLFSYLLRAAFPGEACVRLLIVTDLPSSEREVVLSTAREMAVREREFK